MAETASPEPASSGLKPLVPGLVLAAVAGSWGWLLFIAHYYWGMESYYNFGWFVPLLAAYFLYRILKEDTFEAARKPGIPRIALFATGLAAVVLLVAFVRLFSEANPFWRVPLWAHGMLLLGFSYATLVLFGGLLALKRFAFPLFFLLMALPWPYRFESWMVQSLTHWVTDLTVFVVNFIGYPAVATGNTIQVADTQVGVEEACSGIRSLQALVMMALFFGEFLRFGVGRRLLLLAAAVVLSMGFNGFRAVSLTLVTVNGDADSFQFWHDFLGNFNAIICSVLLFLFAEALVLLFGKGEGIPRQPVGWRLHGQRPAIAAVLAVVLGFLFSEVAVRSYYRIQEARNPALPKLTLEWPREAGLEIGFSDMDEEIREILMCDFSEEVTLQWRNGLQANLTHYGYTGEDRMASVSSFGHSPKVCMTSIGARLLEEKPPMTVELKGIPWQLQHYAFGFDRPAGREVVQVFWLVWEAQQMGVAAEELGSLSWRNQWQLVLNGRRHFGRQVILIYFRGDHSEDVLRGEVQQLLARIVR